MAQSMNNKEIIYKLYEIIMEANLHKPEEEVLEEIHQNPDSDINKYLIKIRLYRTKAKAITNQHKFSKVTEELSELINSAGDRLKELLSVEDYSSLLRFHRNYKEFTEKDKLTMIEDKKLLELLRRLKSDMDDRQKG